MRKGLKRAASLTLAVAMVVTSIQTLPGVFSSIQAKAAATEDVVTDYKQVKIGDTFYDLGLYRNGVYETEVSLGAGTYEAVLYNNGEEIELETEVALTEEGSAIIRYQDGTLKNSTKETLVHSAALVGNFMGIEFLDEAGERYDISSWTPADANAELAYIGGGIYERTFKFVKLENELTVADGGYKVAFDDSWDYSIGKDGGNDNIEITIPAGTSELTIFVDEINREVHDSVRTGDFTVKQNNGEAAMKAFGTTVSLIGTVRGGNDDWNPSSTEYDFTQISDTLYRYQQTFQAGSYSYKCVFNHEKWYEAENDNRSLNVEADGTNVVFLYDTTTGLLYDSINNEDAVAEKLGMTVTPKEPAKAEVTDTKNGQTCFQMVAATGSEVSLYYGEKDEVSKNATSLTKVTMTESSDEAGVFQSGELYFGDDALDIVYYYEVNGERTLDTSHETVAIDGVDYSNYLRAEFTGRTVNIAGTFPGPSWDPTANVMTYEGNGLYTYTFKAVPAANYEYKIAFNSWDPENYGADGKEHGDNISVTVPTTQDVTVFYSDFSHRSVTNIDYIFADITLSGKNIPEGTKLTDDGLTGIYSATVELPADTYGNVAIAYEGETYEFAEFELKEAKKVSFFFDPVSGIFYHNASDTPLETEQIYYNSKDTAYKSVYGAVATGEEVTFSIATGEDAASVLLVIKGMERKTLSMEKDGKAEDGVQKWSATTDFSTIGEYSYYFAVSNGSAVKIYADDDGYYGEGEVTDLTDITPYELVVYKDGFTTPDWMKDAVIYQIFPERFADGDLSNDFAQTSARGETDYEYITDWYTLPENPEQEELLDKETYEATGAYYGDGNWSNEIYGGDIEGIIEHIDYLKALGVNVIYLNPVFASISSHRYDTSDYEMIDPILGDLGDFEELVKVAEENDMHIVLDGVFNHVSDDSKYFDRYYKYLEAGTDTIGAYPYWAYVYDYMEENGVSEEEAVDAARTYFEKNYGITDFSYTEWFDVYQTYLTDGEGVAVTDGIGLRAGKPVYGYEGWWGYDSMPVIMSTNGSEFQTGDWADEIIYSEDESSVTQYWLSEGSNGWRLDVANEVSDETWQNFRSSVKALDSDAVIIGEIWDDATEYLMGDMYDSVMNYVFRSAVLDYAMGGSSKDAMNTLEKIRERYPQEAFYAMMNLVGSHDTARVLSYLDGVGDDRNNKSIEAAFPTYEGTSDLAKERQYLVAFLQFTYAGAPTIYYGDEIGMVGADDPDDRRAFEWGKGNKELVTWYATLAEVRSQYSALRTGSVEPFDCNTNVIGYIRRDDADTIIVLANNSEETQQIELNLSELDVDAETLTDVLTETDYSVTKDTVVVTVPALSGLLLTEEEKEICVDEDALAPAYDESYVVEERVLATEVTLDETKLSLEKGEKASLQASVAPANATNGGELVWSSSNEKVAVVSKDGVVTALAAGKATITATASYSQTQEKAVCEITVTDTSAGEDTGSGATDDGSQDQTGDDSAAGADDGSQAQTGDDSAVENQESTGNVSGTVTSETASNTNNTEAAQSAAATTVATWADASSALATAAAGSTVAITVSKDSDTISGDVLNALAGKDVTLQVALDNGLKWKINGKNMTAGANYGNMDLDVVLNGGSVPASVVNHIPDTKETLALSLAFDGEFGFEMTLNVPVGTAYTGLYANLYYYNENTKALEFVTAAKIGEDGSVDLPFTHASDYIVAISEQNLGNVAAAVKTSDETPLTAIWLLTLGVCILGAGAVVSRKKKRNS